MLLEKIKKEEAKELISEGLGILVISLLGGLIVSLALLLTT